MSVDPSALYPEDVEAVLVAWLSRLRPDTAITYRSGDPLPFTLVNHVAGTESIDEGTVDAIVSVHTLCDKKLGEFAARQESRKTHESLIDLGRDQEVFTLPDGRGVGIEYLLPIESPRREPFGDDNIFREVGRYQLGVSYTRNPTV